MRHVTEANAAQLAARTLAHFDDDQEVGVPRDAIQFSDAATQVAGQHLDAASSSVFGRQRFTIKTSLHAKIGHHDSSP